MNFIFLINFAFKENSTPPYVSDDSRRLEKPIQRKAFVKKACSLTGNQVGICIDSAEWLVAQELYLAREQFCRQLNFDPMDLGQIYMLNHTPGLEDQNTEFPFQNGNYQIFMIREELGVFIRSFPPRCISLIWYDGIVCLWGHGPGFLYSPEEDLLFMLKNNLFSDNFYLMITLFHSRNVQQRKHYSKINGLIEKIRESREYIPLVRHRDKYNRGLTMLFYILKFAIPENVVEL